MISCTEFIMLYSELFKYLEQLRGEEEVVRYWEKLSEAFCTDLQELVEEKGLEGMKEYCDHVLQSECADYSINLTEDKLELFINNCPSLGLLRRNRHMEPYHDYCAHCAVLYAHATDKQFGLKTTLDLIDGEKGFCCRVAVKNKKE